MPSKWREAILAHCFRGFHHDYCPQALAQDITVEESCPPFNRQEADREPKKGPGQDTVPPRTNAQ